MTILYLDCYAGISGDMTVAALLDLGVPLEHLRAELLKLGFPSGSYQISETPTERQHIPAVKFDVVVHDHRTHRHYADIDAMIAVSCLNDTVKAVSRRIFRRLAEAEAKVHGVEIDKVHFHETGAVDSIVDIVGTAICLEYLQVEKINVSPLPMGSGFVETSHGRLPVPAPATAELLTGLPLHGECGPGERVTPTGAAIVVALADRFGTRPAMLLKKTGCGAGSKDFADCPNILRAFLGKSLEETPGTGDRVVVAETNIDDSTPETLGYVMERLFEAGALDVYFSPIQMKKNRPAVILSYICRPELLDTLAHILLTETSAIGLRHHEAERILLDRSVVERETGYGPVRFKEVFDSNGTMLRRSPEYEDCRRIAKERNVPLMSIMSATPLDELNDSLDAELGDLFRKSGMTLALAESCTGGMIAERITAISGSSAYFLEGAVTYSNSAKISRLGVTAETLEKFGAVSSEVATAMSTGIRAVTGSDIGLAVTGIAGPDGGSRDKPVGTVFISLAVNGSCRTELFKFDGNRSEVRAATTRTALEWLMFYVSTAPPVLNQTHTDSENYPENGNWNNMEQGSNIEIRELRK